MNVGGLLEDHLWAMPARVRMVGLSGVRHGAALALVAVQLCSGHDFCLLEPGFLVGTDEEEKKDLTGDFTATTEAIMADTHAGDVILATFFEP